MFEIIFYQNNAESIVVDKQPYLIEVMRLTGTLRNSTSIINPTIMVDIDLNRNVVINNEVFVVSNGNRVIYSMEEALFVANYCYIPKFNRYYYITDIVSVRSDLWSISMSIDVLTSYLDSILEQEMLISRNEFDYDLFLPDTSIPINKEYNHTIIKTEKLKVIEFYPEEQTIEDGNLIIDKECHYIVNIVSDNVLYEEDVSNLGVFGSNVSKLGIPYYFPSYNDFQDFAKNLVNPNFFNSLFTNFSNLSTYIKSIKIVPFDLSFFNHTFNAKSVVGIYFGDRLLPTANFTSYILLPNNQRAVLYTEIEDSIISSLIQDFTDLSPYSKYSLFLPFLGNVDIDINVIISGYKYIVYDLDIISGDVQIGLYNNKPYMKKLNPVAYDTSSSFINDTPYYLWNGNMYAEMGVSGTNQAEVQRNRLIASANYFNGLFNIGSNFVQGQSKAGMGLIGGAVDTAIGYGMGSAPQMMRGGSDMLGSIVDMQNNAIRAYTGVINELHKFSIANFTNNGVGYKGGVNGSLNDYVFDLEKVCICKIKPTIIIPNNYNHICGRPLLKTKKLSDVHGFSVIAGGHLENFNTALEEETNGIMSLLMSGVILP